MEVGASAVEAAIVLAGIDSVAGTSPERRPGLLIGIDGSLTRELRAPLDPPIRMNLEIVQGPLLTVELSSRNRESGWCLCPRKTKSSLPRR